MKRPVLPGTAKELKVPNPFNPGENFYGGIRYLHNMRDLYNGNLVLNLAASNA